MDIGLHLADFLDKEQRERIGNKIVKRLEEAIDELDFVKMLQRMIDNELTDNIDFGDIGQNATEVLSEAVAKILRASLSNAVPKGKKGV